jgi:ATP-binding cassette, subfamily B, bacterial PglK
MQTNNNIFNILKKLNTLLERKDRNKLFILLFMSFLLSIIETVGISAIMPFISIASNPDLIDENKYYSMINHFFEFDNSKKFIIYFGAALITFYVFRGLYTIAYEYLQNTFVMNQYQRFTNKLFLNYLYMPYEKFVCQNTATLTKNIVTEALHLSYMMQSILVLLSELLIIIILYSILLIIDLKMTFALTLFFFSMILILSRTVSRKIKIIGNERASLQDNFYRIINETLGNIKFIKFISNEKKVFSNFNDISNRYSKVYSSNNTLQVLPRSLLEGIGLLVLIFMVMYLVAFSSSPSDIIPIISMYALAMYRILPATTRIITSYNGILFYLPALDIIYDDISYKNEHEFEAPLHFENTINLENVSFSYNTNSTIIDNLSMSIKKNSKVAFIGESGCGKSTLVDLICGIYKPKNGKIFIDDTELSNDNIITWRKKIGYIPQSIYLFDGTISKNITFGRDYDESKLTDVLKQTNLYDFIMQKNGLDTMVGEGGIQLSGGQKQRIGIARALYGDPEILVLDEATSALDTETESSIMEEIYGISQNKTLIIIAHRLSTIEKCDIKIDISKVK